MRTMLFSKAFVPMWSLLLATSILFARIEPADERFGFPEFLEADCASGNWFGVRDTLEDTGVEFFAGYTAEIWGNVAGGERRGAVYTGLLDFGVTLNLEELVGWQGAIIHNSWLWLSGQGPSDRLVGENIFAVSNIEGSATFRLFELWLQQTLLDDAISLRVGQLAAGGCKNSSVKVIARLGARAPSGGREVRRA